MSAKGKKTRPKREGEKAPKESPKRPVGRPPEAMIVARHGTGVVTRLGRGFSKGEVAGAGLSPRLASSWGARIDGRRRSVIEGNVALLKHWGGSIVAPKKTEGKAKRLEVELEKAEVEVEKEVEKVEKEVEKVEKEAAKVGKEVKKEATRAEKAVKAKVKKPRPKAKKKKAD